MFILAIIIAVLSVIAHEYVRLCTASRLGDPTPLNSGRLNFNILKHIDIFGTIIMPLSLMALTRGVICLGYAKPLQLNYYFFKNFKKDIITVSLVGPGLNLASGLIFLIFSRLIPIGFIRDILFQAALINSSLGVFSLMPIPPLDGSKLLTGFISYTKSYKYLSKEISGIIILVFLFGIGLLPWLFITMFKLQFYFFGIKL